LSVKLSIYNQTVNNLKQASKMKKQIILFIAVFFSSQLLIAQTTPTQQIEEFINQKGDGFNKSYESRDTKSFNSLLNEYLKIYEKLPTDDKTLIYLVTFTII
jgi:hypothetical protein